HRIARERRQPHLVPLVREQLRRLLPGRDPIAEIDAVEPVDRRNCCDIRLRGVELTARVAGPADLDAVADTIAVAFHDDPVWSFAFDDEAQRAAQFRRWWPMFVESALSHDWVWMGGRAETVAVWTPPGVPELTHEAEARIPVLLDELLGPRAPLVLQGLLQFEAAHP